jgi:hypothetical protein
MTNKLYLISEGGTYQEVPPEQYGKLEYGAPTLDYMYKAIGCDTIEHLSVLFEDKVHHLFFDENGLASDKKPNARASAIAGNRQLRGVRLNKLRYNDLTKEPPHPLTTMQSTGLLIVGDALLWTGDME